MKSPPVLKSFLDQKAYKELQELIPALETVGTTHSDNEEINKILQEILSVSSILITVYNIFVLILGLCEFVSI